MIAAEVIAQYDLDHPNDIDGARKLFYLKQMEMLVMNEIILTHEIPTDLAEKIIAVIKENEEMSQLDIEDKDPVIYIGKEEKIYEPMKYFDNFDETREMIVPEPYIEVYVDYIHMRIANSLNEAKNYNAAIVKYNNSYNTFFGYWNRTYKPLSTPLKCIHHQILL